MLQSAPDTINSQIEHERTAVAQAISKKNTEPSMGSVSRWRNRISLAAIAEAMDVPIVLATYQGENNVKTVATHGLDLMNNLACFAAVCDELCDENIVIIPDTRVYPAIATLARHWPSDVNCFLVSIPLRDASGKRVGSLSVMNNSRAVAQSGISFRTLADIGKLFSQTGQLQAAATET